MGSKTRSIIGIQVSFYSIVYVLLYLLVIVVSNIAISKFGLQAVIPVAFIMIGFELVIRDRLHDMWDGKGLGLKMGLLVITGSVITVAVNSAAMKIAIASFVAFALAFTADALVYHFFNKRNRLFLVKSNMSNIAGATVDSIVFPSMAFGGWFPLVSAGQLLAKVLGGVLWSLLFAAIAYIYHRVRNNND